MASRLELRQVSKTFEGTKAVDGVSLSVGAGEVVCLLGPSGCGKSTTLRLAAGLERTDQGEVWIDGRRADGAGTFVAPEARQVGLMFQDFALFPHLSVRENVAFGLRRLAKSERDAAALAELEKVGMTRFANAYPHELSGGEQQRVALARALAPRPHVMLMDEPFSGLDDRLRDAVRDETIAALRARETAVLLVTHTPEEAMRVGDRIALMRAGRIVQMGAPEAVYDNPADAAAAAFFSDLNVVHATVEGGRARTPFGVVAAAWPEGARVEVMFRPQFVHFGDDAPVKARVNGSRLLGDDSLVEVAFERPEASEAGETIVFRARVHGRYLPTPGTEVGVRVELDRAFIFPCAGGNAVSLPRQTGSDRLHKGLEGPGAPSRNHEE